MEELIRVTQLPVIEERLRLMKDDVQKTVAEATSLACTPETVTAVKKTRADLSKRLAAMEDQRKKVKRMIMEPYERFEAIYAECVSTPLKQADADLKEKINATEDGIKSRAEQEMREFFAELALAHHVEWLTYDRMNLTISMAEAKQTTYKRLREEITAFITGVSDSVESIDHMEGRDEIMAEFKQTLSLAVAVGRVYDRNRRIEEERQAAEARQKAQEAAREAAKRVESVYTEQTQKAAQEPLSAPMAIPATDEKIYKVAFTCHGTRSQLKALKEFMNWRGIRYE